ncbi:MAG: DUF2752 domain-containing protein [Lachnospiraceae bacterium]|nr:DUF2752 domain-containing protein [Lachnospiraceae bacterium]
MSKLNDYCKKKNLKEMDHEHLLIYRICLCMLPFMILAVIVFFIWGDKVTNLGDGCVFKKMTGLYCIGCGGTRAFNHLVHLRLFKSICFHPFVPYAFFAYILFTVNSFLFRHNKICFKKLNPFVLMVIGLGLMAVNFIVRNILLFVFSIPTL